MNDTAGELRSQWARPSDILSLLLILGGDIVQTAIASLVGYKLRLPGRKNPTVSIAPVAFSFGWVAYGFLNLIEVVGDMQLMPATNYRTLCINCANGFPRDTKSWVLGRLLRDHSAQHKVDPKPKEQGGRADSIRIDVFNLDPVSTPKLDFVWWFGWVVVLAQFGIAIVPRILYGDWGPILVTACGSLLAAITCAIPQWTEEKWPDRRLEREKVVCLTNGNGSLHIMVLIGAPGAWDIEKLATGWTSPRRETRWISLILATLWTFLIITVSGLQQNTWFLIGIGALGMLQNIFAAGTTRQPAASNFHMTPFSRAPTIIGRRGYQEETADASINIREEDEKLADISAWVGSQGPKTSAKIMPQWLDSMSEKDGAPEWLIPLKPQNDRIIYAVGVHGALMELEKWVPTAGLAMMQMFFPAGLKYNDEAVRDNIHKKFWRRAYHTLSIRKRAESKRRLNATK